MATETVSLLTMDGVQLAGDRCDAGPNRPRLVICHPHPAYGGDRHNLVVDAVFRACEVADIAALRFDFRGAGASGGRQGEGKEHLDVTAAIDALAGRDGRVHLAGYSFGAAVALAVLDERIESWIAIAPPLGHGPPPGAGADPRPKHLFVAEHDQFCPPPAARDATAAWSSTSLEIVPMADHFLTGQARALADRVVQLVTAERQLPPR